MHISDPRVPIKFITFEDKAFSVAHVRMVVKRDLPKTRVVKHEIKDAKESTVTEENTRPFLFGIDLGEGTVIPLAYATKEERDRQFTIFVDALNA